MAKWVCTVCGYIYGGKRNNMKTALITDQPIFHLPIWKE